MRVEGGKSADLVEKTVAAKLSAALEHLAAWKELKKLLKKLKLEK